MIGWDFLWFLLVSYADPPELCNHEIDCYLFSSNGKLFVTTRTLPPIYESISSSPLYSLLVHWSKFRDRILKDDYWSENGIEFVLKCYCCQSLQIVRCGCRLVCKQDVKDWNKVMNQFNESWRYLETIPWWTLSCK
jgi:hypothetical protein